MSNVAWQVGESGSYCNLKIDQLLGVRAHLIVKTEFVFAGLLGCEHGVHLPLLIVVHYDVIFRTTNAVIHIE